MNASSLVRRARCFVSVLLPAAGLPGLAHAQPGGAAPMPDPVPLVARPSALVERLAGPLRLPWSLAFLHEGEALLTEKHHGLRLMRDGRLVAGVLDGGPPQVLTDGDSGYLDVAPDPDYAHNRIVWLAFVEGSLAANRLALWRARFDGTRLTDGRVVFRTAPDKKGSGHPGGRLLFLPDGSLLLTVGDGFDFRDAAQDLGSHLGKVLRLDREGRAAAGNPYVDRPGARPEVYTYGHRNAQGLALDRKTGEVWLHEHGPRGGDELNRLRAGANYGWPLFTHGIGYDGKPISERALGDGIEASAFYWAPSIAPSGLVIYRGRAFSGWDGKVLVGALAARAVVLLRRGRETGLFIEEQRMLGELGKRVRDLREGPDGLIYLLADEQDGHVLRLRPLPAAGGR